MSDASELKLFVVSSDSVDYWVTAYQATDCPALIRAVCEEEVDWEIGEMDLADAQTRDVNDDDSSHPSGKTSLAELFARCSKPEILACSEW